MMQINSNATLEETRVQENSKPEPDKLKTSIENEYCEVKIENLNFFMDLFRPCLM